MTRALYIVKEGIQFMVMLYIRTPTVMFLFNANMILALVKSATVTSTDNNINIVCLVLLSYCRLQYRCIVTAMVPGT